MGLKPIHDERRFPAIKKFLKFYFRSIGGISYSQTSNFTFYIDSLAMSTGEVQSDVLNVREIVNLFIAEGFYKFQSNYMHSKLQYSELRNLCAFIVFKMKTSGFLNVIGSDMEGVNIGQDKSNLTKIRRSSIMLNFKKRGQILSKEHTEKIFEGDTHNVVIQKAFGMFQDRSDFQLRVLLDARKRIYVDGEFFTTDNSMKFVIRKGEYLESELFYKDLREVVPHLVFVEQLVRMKLYKEVLRRTITYYRQRLLNIFEKENQFLFFKENQLAEGYSKKRSSTQEVLVQKRKFKNELQISAESSSQSSGSDSASQRSPRAALPDAEPDSSSKPQTHRLREPNALESSAQSELSSSQGLNSHQKAAVRIVNQFDLGKMRLASRQDDSNDSNEEGALSSSSSFYEPHPAKSEPFIERKKTIIQQIQEQHFEELREMNQSQEASENEAEPEDAQPMRASLLHRDSRFKHLFNRPIESEEEYSSREEIPLESSLYIHDNAPALNASGSSRSSSSSSEQKSRADK